MEPPAGDYSGESVRRAGDVNGDGYDDFFIGAALGDNGTKLNVGAGYLIYGGPSLPSTLDLANLGSAGIKILGAEAGDTLGTAVTSADLNGDGYSDLVLGAQTADGLNNLRSNSGETHVIFGGPSLPATIDLAVPGTGRLTIHGAGAGGPKRFPHWREWAMSTATATTTC